MTSLTTLLKQTDDELFDNIASSFKDTITGWDYYVDWTKILRNISAIEKELNLLNVLIGKGDDFEQQAFSLLNEYPQVVKAFPILIALRTKSVKVMVDTKNFIYKKYNFRKRNLTEEECHDLIKFIEGSGLKKLFQNKQIKNIVDYVTGVEVGLDTNARKNRGGSLMESIVEEYVAETCNTNSDLLYMPQATLKKISEEWGIKLTKAEYSRQIDFAINKNGQLYFIECNFYSGTGSKLKATAGEYTRMHEIWKQQGIVFIWVTDGGGWKSTLKPLREYFDKTDYLLNLEMLKKGLLKTIIEQH